MEVKSVAMQQHTEQGIRLSFVKLRNFVEGLDPPRYATAFTSFKTHQQHDKQAYYRQES
jgi:hypothetical protein